MEKYEIAIREKINKSDRRTNEHGELNQYFAVFKFHYLLRSIRITTKLCEIIDFSLKAD